MKKQELINNITYLINKYASEKEELLDLLTQDIDSVKYILSKIDEQKIYQYESADVELIKDICFYYV